MQKEREAGKERLASLDFVEQIETASGEKVRICYQCGKCSAGCPVGYFMDQLPNQVMRLVQLGMKDEVLSCSSIWLCASCETCATRCPRGIGIVRVMDTLRHQAHREGYHTHAREVVVFVNTFISNLKRFGRLYELGLVAIYNIMSGHLTKDLEKAPSMLLRRKISLLPSNIRGAARIRAIMRRIQEIEKQ